MVIEKIMIIGNWDLGLSILSALLPSTPHPNTPKYQISILTYPSQTLSLPSRIPPSTVQHLKSDFTPSSLHATFANLDLLISTTSGGDSDLQTLIIDAAVSAHVPRFIPHEFSHDTLNSQICSRIPKHAGRAKVLAHLRDISQRTNSKGLEYVAIATGYTLDTSLLNGAMGFDMEWHSATIHGIGTESFAASSLAHIGRAVSSVVQNWDKVKNQYIYVAGVITSANEVLRSAEKATGREWTVGNYDIEDCVAEGQKRIEKGWPDSGMFLLERSVLYDEEVDGVGRFRGQSVNALLGLEGERIEEIVRDAFHDLTEHGKPGCGCAG